MKRLFVVIAIPAIIFVAILFFQKPQSQKGKTDTGTITSSFKPASDPAYIKKNIDSVNLLVEIPDKNKARVIEVIDPKILEQVNKIFKKSYKGDLVILLPDKTIIYDPLTNTIRDISSVSLYEKF